MDLIDRLQQTSRGSGVIIVGRFNADPGQIFDDLCRKLSEFYQREQDFVLVTSAGYDPTRERYELPVYNPEDVDVQMEHIRDPQQEGVVIGVRPIITRPPTIGTVAIIPLTPRTRREYVPDWDFPHVPLERTVHSFLVYFNMKDVLSRLESEQAGRSYRDDFCTYMNGKVR